MPHRRVKYSGTETNMTYMTYSQLKDSARARLKPVIGRFVGAAAIYYGLMAAANRLTSVSSVFRQSFALRMVLFFLFTVLAETFVNMLSIGLHYMMLKLYCGRPVQIGDLFYPFANRSGTCLGASFFMSLISEVPIMPAFTFFMRYSMEAEKISIAALSSSFDASAVTITPEMMTLLSLAFFCCTPALILITLLQITYSQVFYLLLDFPSCTLKQLFRGSRLLMRGHKGRYFYIKVSMLPLILIGGLFTCGIGTLWITPFIYAVTTEFYLDLITKRKI